MKMVKDMCVICIPNLLVEKEMKDMVHITLLHGRRRGICCGRNQAKSRSHLGGQVTQAASFRAQFGRKHIPEGA